MVFYIEEGIVKVVDDVSFMIYEEEMVCIVGEFGCGKSMVLLFIMQFIFEMGRIEWGVVYFFGRNLLELKLKEMQKICGCEIGMIFQELMIFLNLVFMIGEQLIEFICEYLLLSKKEVWWKVVELIMLVEIFYVEQVMY